MVGPDAVFEVASVLADEGMAAVDEAEEEEAEEAAAAAAEEAAAAAAAAVASVERAAVRRGHLTAALLWGSTSQGEGLTGRGIHPRMRVMPCCCMADWAPLVLRLPFLS